MATSFLQFCPTCEKQIVVPDNSILYCSQRCHKHDNSKPLSDVSTQSREIPSPFPRYRLRPPQNKDDSNELSSSECLLRSVPRPSQILAGSTTSLTRQRRDRSRPDVESDAARYLSQFASQLPHIRSKTRRRAFVSRSTTSISTMATVSTVTSMTTSSAPSLIHTPASSLDVSAPASPTRRFSALSLYHDPSYFHNVTLATVTTRSARLVTPVPFPSEEGSSPASVPTNEAEAEKLTSFRYSTSKSDCQANTNLDYTPKAAASSMPAKFNDEERSLFPLGTYANEGFVYSKQAMSSSRDLFPGNLKQLLDGGTAQISL